MSNFKESKAKGKIGEKWFMDFCIDKGIICIDVSENESIGFESGIDFVVEYSNGQIRKFDVKMDSRIHSTGNMFIETYINKNSGKRGWYYTSKADSYCYIDEYVGVLYMFAKSALECYIDAHPNLPTAYCQDGYKRVEGILVSIEAFTRWCKDNERNLVKYARLLDRDDIDEVM